MRCYKITYNKLRQKCALIVSIADCLAGFVRLLEGLSLPVASQITRSIRCNSLSTARMHHFWRVGMKLGTVGGVSDRTDWLLDHARTRTVAPGWGDLKRPMIFSRRRVCRCDASERLFNLLCCRCSIPGAFSAFAAAYEPSLSVTMTRGWP